MNEAFDQKTTDSLILLVILQLSTFGPGEDLGWPQICPRNSGSGQK